MLLAPSSDMPIQILHIPASEDMHASYQLTGPINAGDTTMETTWTHRTGETELTIWRI